MEPNLAGQRRCDTLKQSICQLLSETLQSDEAHAELEKAFPACGFPANVGTADNIIASLVSSVQEVAMARVNELILQSNIKHTLDTIDEHYVSVAARVTPQHGSMTGDPPKVSLPNATLAALNVSRKKKDLAKLKDLLEEKEQITYQLQERVNAHARDVGSMHSKILTFSQSAEDAFQTVSTKQA